MVTSNGIPLWDSNFHHKFNNILHNFVFSLSISEGVDKITDEYFCVICEMIFKNFLTYFVFGHLLLQFYLFTSLQIFNPRIFPKITSKLLLALSSSDYALQDKSFKPTQICYLNCACFNFCHQYYSLVHCFFVLFNSFVLPWKEKVSQRKKNWYIDIEIV